MLFNKYRIEGKRDKQGPCPALPPPFPFLAVPPYDLVAIYVINYAKKVWLGIERAQLYVQVYCKKILER